MDSNCYNTHGLASKSLGISLAVGQRTLDPWAQVRILDPQPLERSQLNSVRVAHSSSGLGHRPLKAEIRGSNPLCATKAKITPCFEAKSARQGVSFYDFANVLLTTCYNGFTFRLMVQYLVKAISRCFLNTRCNVAISINRHLNTGMA